MKLPKTASDIGKPIAQDVAIGAEVAKAKERETWVQFYQRLAKSIP